MDLNGLREKSLQGVVFIRKGLSESFSRLLILTLYLLSFDLCLRLAQNTTKALQYNRLSLVKPRVYESNSETLNLIDVATLRVCKLKTLVAETEHRKKQFLLDVVALQLTSQKITL